MDRTIFKCSFSCSGTKYKDRIENTLMTEILMFFVLLEKFFCKGHTSVLNTVRVCVLGHCEGR